MNYSQQKRTDFWGKSNRITLKLYCDKSLSSERVSLRVGVTPNNVSSFVGLEVPWQNYDYIAVTYPNTSLHFSSDAAESLVAVLAFDHDAIETEEFCDDT